jgi:hypothetical protein
MEEDEDSTGEPFYFFTFSMSAIDRLELLDPREAVQIEVTPSPIEKAKTTLKIAFEVGDLRAAHAFAMIPKLAPSALAAAETPAAAGH